MPSRTYVAQRLGAFAGLVQANELAGYRLEPLPAVGLRDHYYDTEDADLLRQGMCIRIRDQEGAQRALLRPIRPDDEGPTVEIDLDGVPNGVFDAPKGELHEALEALVGGHAPGRVSPLQPLLTLRQYRTPRVAYDGSRLVGVMSFDVVVLELPDGPHATNELDVEIAQDGREEDIHALDPLLRAGGLAPVDLTKFERNLQRMPRSLTQPLLLLPSERDVLDAYAASESPLHRRRAEVLLLDARGFRSATIASQVGLSTARVRHWKALFREQRMSIFETPSSAPVADPPRYHVSEIVHGEAVAAPGSRPLPPLAVSPDAEGSETLADGPPPSPLSDGAEPPLEDAHPAGPIDSASRGDGAPADLPLALPTDLGDIDDLLDLFQPRPTGTPLLDDPPSPEASGDEDSVVEGTESDDKNQTLARPDEVDASTAEVAVPVAMHASPGPDPADAPEAPNAPEASGGMAGASGESQEAAPSMEVGSVSVVRTARRPRIHPDDSLVKAALDVLAYHFGQIGWCAADLDRPHGAYRLYLSVHRVRLSLEVFQPALPQETVQTLHRGLRRLAAGLDHALHLDRLASSAPEDADLAQRAERARESVRALLEDRSFEVWIGRAQRLVDRLALQQRAGVETPDDAPAPWDDYSPETGSVRPRSRMRHLLGSALWTRVEAVLAWEQDGAAPLASDAQKIALACSGIRFVLGLAESASPEAVRKADALLERSESAFLDVARAYSDGAPLPMETFQDAWNRVRSEPLRDALARTLAAL